MTLENHRTDLLDDAVKVIEFCRFALEPYDDIKPRDWATDRQNLIFAHKETIGFLVKIMIKEQK